MTRSLDYWWSRRQWATGLDVPYPVGRFGDAWGPFPRLAEQYRPERNADLALSQIPPAAEVYLVWVCGLGHEFVATPAEQRSRPVRTRARGDWCPVCAVPSPVAAPSRYPRPPAQPVTSADAPRRVLSTRPRLQPPRDGDPTPRRAGIAFRSAAASTATSVAQETLRVLLSERLECDLSATAITVRTPFFGKREVWPDVVIADLAVAIEYDTIGRAADEHVGRRERADRQKDRILGEVGWTVVRLRQRPLRPLNPHDLVVSGISGVTADALVDRIAELRGPLIVDAYRRDASRRPSRSAAPGDTAPRETARPSGR